MNARYAAALVTVTLALITACSATRPNSTPPVASPTEPPQTSAVTATPGPTAAPSTRVLVTLTDQMKIEPGAITVPAGKPITFVVTNAGQIAHEFTIGDADVQDEHEREMMEMGGMTHDEDNAISVDPGATKELTYTFQMPGMSLAGCHVRGHYPAGMKATITIVE